MGFTEVLRGSLSFLRALPYAEAKSSHRLLSCVWMRPFARSLHMAVRPASRSFFRLLISLLFITETGCPKLSNRRSRSTWSASGCQAGLVLPGFHKTVV